MLAFSLPNWRANSWRHPSRRGIAVNGNLPPTPAAIAEKSGRARRGQFDREEVKTMSDIAVHRRLTLPFNG